MIRLGLNKDTIKYLEKQAQKKASELAHEAQQRLTDGYVSFIDLYYSDYTPQQYVRTHNLYRSYNKFYKNSHGTIFYGGVEVTPERMFDNYDQITPSYLMSEFIYNPKGTYHGWYNIPASFSVYREMHKYHERLKDEYRKRCTV